VAVAVNFYSTYQTFDCLQLNSKLFKAFFSYLTTIQWLIEHFKIQGCFTSGLEFKAGTNYYAKQSTMPMWWRAMITNQLSRSIQYLNSMFF